MKLLIADDEKIEREALKHFFSLNDLGIEVVGEASNGLQAVELNRTLNPDIIIMDIRMGILDGLEATNFIKKDNVQVEIIILTAFGLFEYSQKAIKSRVFDYLLKPVEEKELINAIEKVKKHIESRSGTLNADKRDALFDFWIHHQDVEGEKSYDYSFSDERICEVISYIMNHLESELSLGKLAALAHINASYLSRLFKNTTGLTISNFILEARVEKAKFFLINQHNIPIKVISEEVGFSNISHFSNTFKRLTGTTPAKYRLTEKERSS